MYLHGIDYIQQQIPKQAFSAKMVFNANGAIFIPVTAQHADQSGPGIQYKDNYKGNALAAMLAPGKIEIRFHRDYSDTKVATIIAELKRQPDLDFMVSWNATYQGRPLDQ